MNGIETINLLSLHWFYFKRYGKDERQQIL